VKTQGRYLEAVEMMARVRDVAFSAPNPQARIRGPYFMHGMALSDADRLEEAAEAFRRAAEECNELETWWLLPDIQLMAAEVRLLRGEWEDAALEISGGLDSAREHGNMITLPRFHGYLALIAAAKGDVAAGEQALAPVATELTSDHPRFSAEFVFYAAAVLDEVAGRPAAALEQLERFYHHDAERDNRYGHRFIAPVLTRALVDRLAGARLLRDRPGTEVLL
jgi:tetratricopeptide (TPR) repeat protein